MTISAIIWRVHSHILFHIEGAEDTRPACVCYSCSSRLHLFWVRDWRLRDRSCWKPHQPSSFFHNHWQKYLCTCQRQRPFQYNLDSDLNDPWWMLSDRKDCHHVARQYGRIAGKHQHLYNNNACWYWQDLKYTKAFDQASWFVPFTETAMLINKRWRHIIHSQIVALAPSSDADQSSWVV